jgi:hypothetical protein
VLILRPNIKQVSSPPDEDPAIMSKKSNVEAPMSSSKHANTLS